MSTYSYKNPKFINSPKGVVEVVEVIYDGKDDPAYSLAIIKWENTYKLGIRWSWYSCTCRRSSPPAPSALSTTITAR